LPGFRAGGPVQSLVNLIGTLGNDYQFYIVTSAYDVGNTIPYQNIQVNQWNGLILEGFRINVFYATKKINYRCYFKLLKELAADFVFFNCMYSFCFFLFPLFNKKKLFAASQKIIISPRGILQPGSLQVKSFKKKLYLFILKQSGLLSKCIWHATGKSEFESIIQYFGNHCTIETIGNVPKQPLSAIRLSTKDVGVLKLVHLSLITPVKNIQFLIEVCNNCTQKIILDIYGPIKDVNYWHNCIQSIHQSPKNIFIQYKGDLQPNFVQTTLANYDALILLTKGENFGHALFEGLSVGRPIITSFFTPWMHLQKNKSGWNVNIDEGNQITALLDQLALADNEEWANYCDAAHHMAKQYFFKDSNFRDSYIQLFNTTME
jgi:glycosyltransferase involved in cell wall biosynthesis